MLALAQVLVFGFKYLWPLVWAIAFFHKTDVRGEGSHPAFKFACLVTVAWLAFCFAGYWVCFNLAFA